MSVKIGKGDLPEHHRVKSRKKSISKKKDDPSKTTNDAATMTHKKENICNRDVQNGENETEDDKSDCESDQDKVLFHVDCILSENSEAPEDKKVLGQHENVALSRKQFRIKDYQSNSLNYYKKSVNDLFSEQLIPSDDFCHTLLLQVTHGLHHMHKKNIPHGMLTTNHIYFSCDMKHIKVTDWQRGTSPVENGDEIKDIKNLAHIFYFVLTKGQKDKEQELTSLPQNCINVEALKCTDEEIAKDLIDKMLQPDTMTTEDILKHPFFWDTEQKINFICDAFDFSKPSDESKYSTVEEDFNEGADSVFQGDWSKLLKLHTPEVTDIRKELRRTKAKTQICVDALVIKAKKYNDSYYGLMHFFRNCKAHYWHLRNHEKICFQGYPQGFWRFFSKRFPRFLLHLYGKQSSFKSTNSANKMASNRLLP